MSYPKINWFHNPEIEDNHPPLEANLLHEKVSGGVIRVFPRTAEHRLASAAEREVGAPKRGTGLNAQACWSAFVLVCGSLWVDEGIRSFDGGFISTSS